MRRHSTLGLWAALILAGVIGPGLASTSAALEEPAAQTGGMNGAAGTYSSVLPLGGGYTFLALMTLHADGTVTTQDVSDFGAASVASGDGPHLNSVAVGSWKHTTGRSYTATLVYFRSATDAAGEVTSIGRLTLSGTFDEGFQTATGPAIVENFPCVPATIGCPDPALLPPPTAAPLGTFTSTRIIP